MPDVYAHGHHASVTTSHARRGIDDSAAYLLPVLDDEMTLLDVGCGPGSITLEFAERFPRARIIGVDASAQVIAEAQHAAAARGLTNVEFHVDDAYALNLADASVDVVHAHQVLQHLARPVDALREFRRVVRTGGQVAVRDVDYEGISWFPLLPEIAEWLDLYLKISRHNGGEPSAARRLRSWFREAGYPQTQITGSVWTYASAEEVERWGSSWAIRTTESNFGAQAREYGLATDATLARIADGWRTFAESPDGWFQLPHGEVLARV